MGRESEIDLTALTDWVLEQGLGDTTLDTLVAGIGEQLNAAGIPVIRSHLSVAMLHPRIEARSCSWWRDDGVTETGHELGSSEREDWQGSPLAALLESRKESLRCRICDGDGLDRFAVMHDFVARGGTDYLSFVVGFGDGQTAIDRRDGMLCSWVSDRPGGFTDAEVAALYRLRRRFALAVKVIMREELAGNIVHAYLGERAGQKVLDGSIHLGDGEMIEAVIWFSDLRDSSGHLERSGIDGYLPLMNDYFEATAGAVQNAGGDILRFVGDAMLAIFPLDRFGSARAAVTAALDAHEESRRRQVGLNERRTGDGERIDFTVGLHLGQLLYGNVGIQERLEFTVVGSAANLAARIERVASEGGWPLVLSSDVAVHAAGRTRPVGDFNLKGFADGIQLHTVDHEFALAG
jgi:adenylate cyclase